VSGTRLLSTGKALPLAAEIRRQLSRRRTLVLFAVLVALPLVLVAAFAFGGPDDGTGQRGFVDLAQDSGANLVVFALFASTGFLLVVVVALFAANDCSGKSSSPPACSPWPRSSSCPPGRSSSAGSRTAGAPTWARPATSWRTRWCSVASR